MNAFSAENIADVQSSQDTRQIPINKVGIKDIRHPVVVSDRSGGEQHTIANFNMYVNLPHNFKGTHMSRFVEILNNHEREITVKSFKEMLSEMTERLEAESGHIEMSFPYFVNKKAPISGVQSLMDYDVTFIGEIIEGKPSLKLKVLVPVTSLCLRCTQPAFPRHHHRPDHRLHLDRGHHRPGGERGLMRTVRPAQAPGRKICHRARLRQSQVRGRHGARCGRPPKCRRAHLLLRGGIGEFRIHP